MTTAQGSLPVYSVRQVSDFLVEGYWSASDIPAHAFSLGSDRALSVNINGLSSQQKETARLALEIWTATTGIKFTFVSGSAEVTLVSSSDHEANSTVRFSGNASKEATVAVGDPWAEKYGYGMGSYTLQTWIHEIGHALGLGHAGFYDGSADYAQDALYANDSWQMSVMSYFSQWENSFVEADYAYAMTPMLADMMAIRDLYGRPTSLRIENSTYGNNANTGDLYQKLGPVLGSIAWTIVDDGGVDTLDLTADTTGARIDLTPGGISSAWGLIGNLAIESRTLLENVRGGSGSDLILGNQANNRLVGNAGADTICGGAGADTLQGGLGNDSLQGAEGRDALIGAAAQDVLNGGSGQDTLSGGSGDDRLWGGFGQDVIEGGQGHDSLRGGAGDDSLRGDAGSDLLIGSDGNDLLSGGVGSDRFVFGLCEGENHDRLMDFSKEDGDRLFLDDALWGQVLSARAAVDQFCRIDANGALFEFDDLNNIRVDGITSLDQLYGHVAIF